MEQMKSFAFLFCSLFTVCPVTAQTGACIREQQTTVPVPYGEKYEYRMHPAVKAPSDASPVTSEITTTKAGELVELLGDALYNTDSLVVAGPIDDTDIQTMWDASFNGVLSAINMENAVMENGILPQDAFFHGLEQIDLDHGYIYLIRLRNIILPKELDVIGQDAFLYAANLEQVTLPKRLRAIDEYAFSDCVKLQTSPLIIPEGTEVISGYAFLSCGKLREVVLPSSIRELGEGAFFSAKITSINLPEGLETLGNCAFYGSNLKEVVIPGSCRNYEGTEHFSKNYEMERVRVCEGVETIPKSCFEDNMCVKEVQLPTTLKRICRNAFHWCSEIKELELPNGLEVVEAYAFNKITALEQVLLPPTLKELGKEIFGSCPSLQRLYCMATEPPVCVPEDDDATPFGIAHSKGLESPISRITVYVPVGCAEKYRNAWGWDCFAHIEETDDFPTTGIALPHADASEQPTVLYDLTGRRLKDASHGRVFIQGGRKMLNP